MAATKSQGALFQYGDGSGPPEKYTTLGGVHSISGPGLSAETIDVTALDDTARAYISDGVEGAEVSLEIHWEANSAAQLAFITRLEAGTQATYQIAWPNRTANTAACSAVNTTTERITSATHGMVTGEPVQLSSIGFTSVPQVAAATTYYVARVDANDFTLHLTNAAAVAGSDAINFTDGTETATLSRVDVWNFEGQVSSADPSASLGDSHGLSLTMQVTGAVTE